MVIYKRIKYSGVALRQPAEVERSAMYTIYAIYNSKHSKIYIGQTQDLSERLRLHNEHIFRGYTARFDGEWQLIHSEEVDTRQQALIREKQLKSFRGREFVKQQLG